MCMGARGFLSIMPVAAFLRALRGVKDACIMVMPNPSGAKILAKCQVFVWEHPTVTCSGYQLAKHPRTCMHSNRTRRSSRLW